MSAAVRLTRRMLSARITLGAFALFVVTPHCSTANVDPFSLVNTATGVCLMKKYNLCLAMRWTTGNRLFATATLKCLGAQGSSVGSEVGFYDCDEKSDLQKWECKNNTMLALKGKELYIEVRDDESIALSKNTGPKSHFTIQSTPSGACTRTHRELYTIEGNANGKICMFPFMYKDVWYGKCTATDSPQKRPWCAVGTRYEQEEMGYCPTTSSEHWLNNVITGSYYQLNTQAALTWPQAEISCKQQGATLLSVTNPHEQAYVSALIGSGKYKLWIGLVLDPEHGWQWSSGKPFRYMRWSSGNPLPIPGHSCGVLDTVGQHLWQSSSCGKKMGYICYKDGITPTPPQIEQGFCSSPWIPYNGHCFQLQRSLKTWSEAQIECRKEGGDLVSIRNVEDQSFVISQLGYGSNDELWIGLNDRKTKWLFDWSDHSKVSFTSWEYGKPEVAFEGQNCVLIKGEKGNWADRSCDEKHGFVCMKQSETDRPSKEVNLDIGCKAGWKRHGSYCYFVGTATKTFDEAKEDCKSSDSYLADVSNGVDNAFLVSLVGLRPEKYFWLGLSNQENIDEFVWTSKDSVRFTHWNAEMPGYQQGCVAMTTGIFAGLWDLLPCTNQEKYICKHLAEGAVLTVPPPTKTPLKCAEGWSPVGSRNVCFKFFTGPRSSEKTWFEARDYCRAIGGDLLSIHGRQDQIVGRYGRAWIGLHVPDSSTGYAWSDGSPLNFQHWREGEPNNFNNAESCVEFKIYHWDTDGSWNDVNCEAYNDWLCQIRKGVTPKAPPNATLPVYNTTSDGWLVWRGTQYFINTMSMPQDEAREFCQKRHGDLVSISSKDENTFLWKQISRQYGYYYIGLSVDLDGSYWWLDGTQMSVQLWDENQPSAEAFDENCVKMTYYMGFWDTTNCGHEYQSICKRGGSVPANSTAAPTVAPKGGCPLKWMKFDTKCYTINSQRLTWEDARRQCITIGGNLASITERRVQAFLTSSMAGVATADLWIGLNSIKRDGFYWADGRPRRYTNWEYTTQQRHPSSFYQRWNEEECVLMNINPSFGIGKWFIKNCNDTNGFVCSRNLDPNIPANPEPAVPNYYKSVGNDTIRAVTQNLTWDNAKRQCEGDKAHLVTLRTEWTQAYVELLALNLKAPLWIGLNKQQTGGYFMFINGWHLNFVNWAQDEPKRGRPCVYIDVDGKWKTAFCNETMYSVCMQSTDVAPTESTVFPGICPEESVEYYPSVSWVPFKGHCYLLVMDEVEWATAASSCARHGGMLASIEDPAEQKFIFNNVRIFKDGHTSFWIGLYKTHKGTWLWLDKTILDYTNWAEGEPNSDFASIEILNGTWRSGRRWHDRPYICKTTKVMPDDPYSKPEPHVDPRSRVHTSVIVVLIIAIISSLIVIGFFIYKKAPVTLPTFDNPLYFNSERSQPDVVDTNKLIEKAEDDTPEPIIAL